MGRGAVSGGVYRFRVGRTSKEEEEEEEGEGYFVFVVMGAGRADECGDGDGDGSRATHARGEHLVLRHGNTTDLMLVSIPGNAKVHGPFDMEHIRSVWSPYMAQL